MKRTLLTLTLFVLACEGGTKVNISDVKLTFDPACFILDSSTPTPTLRLSPACTGSGGGPAGTDTRNDFIATPGQLTFTTSAAPLSTSLVDLYRNGMIQTVIAGDYTSATDGSGKVIVTIPAIAAGDVIVMRYRR